MSSFSTRNLKIGASIAAASTSAALYLLHKYVYPLPNLQNDPELPAKWVPYRKPSTDVVFPDRLRCCEDVIIDAVEAMAIISCDPGRPRWNTVMGTMYDPAPKGTLYLYDYVAKSEPRAVRLVGLPETSDFHPLGINFFRSAIPGSQVRLFVVNHQRNGSTVDIFDLDYANAAATFITSICDGDKNILSPNAIAPISYTSFYVTNDHYFIPRLHPFLNINETMRALPLGWLTLVDFSVGKPQFSTAASGIPFANGVVITPTGKEVIVASTTAPAIFVYDRDPETNKLSKCREKIKCKFWPDNLSFDESIEVSDSSAFDKDGRFLRGLICAGHPSAMQLARMSREPSKVSAPSWVVEIRRKTTSEDGMGDQAPCRGSEREWGGNYWSKTLYQSDGSHFPSSSTGGLDSKRKCLLVSGLYAEGLLDIKWEE